MAVVDVSLGLGARPGAALGRVVGAWLADGVTLDESAVPEVSQLLPALTRVARRNWYQVLWGGLVPSSGEAPYVEPLAWLRRRPEPEFGKLSQQGFSLFSHGSLRWTVRVTQNSLRIVFPAIVWGRSELGEAAQARIAVAAAAAGVPKPNWPSPAAPRRRVKAPAPPGVGKERGPAEASWTGASGSFAGGAPEARAHWQKHVAELREWDTTAMSEPGTYTQRGATLLDRLDVHEFYQRENDAVVKYDARKDELAVGRRRDGMLFTYFRPGGPAYAVRQLQRRRWELPLRRAGLSSAPAALPSELEDCCRELRVLAAELEAQAALALAGEVAALVPMLAAQTRLARAAHVLASKAVTSPEEEAVDEALLDLGAAQGAAAAVVEGPGGPSRVAAGLRAGLYAWWAGRAGEATTGEATIIEADLHDALVALRAPTWRRTAEDGVVQAAIDEVRGWRILARAGAPPPAKKVP